MKRRNLIVAFVVVLAGTSSCLLIWSWGQHPGAKVSVTLLGYTNDVTGMRVFGYAGSNLVRSSGFALFSAQNPTRTHFGCSLSCILLSQAGTGKAEVIPLKRSIHSVQTGKAMLIGPDFQLSPGAALTFAVPRPEAHGSWQCFLSLTHVYNYKEHPWQTQAVIVENRLGLHFGEKGQLVSSGEIAQ